MVHLIPLYLSTIIPGKIYSSLPIWRPRPGLLNIIWYRVCYFLLSFILLVGKEEMREIEYERDEEGERKPSKGLSLSVSLGFIVFVGVANAGSISSMVVEDDVAVVGCFCRRGTRG